VFGPVNYTPRSQNVLRHAERIAQEHGHNHVGTEHLILGLLAEPGGIAGQVLERLGVTTSVAAMTEEIMASPGYSTSSRKMIR
jgi:ATP-dependent Clp protease ATP-binding subunit ClpC